MKSIISSHNKSLLNRGTDSSGCNCKKKNECPLQNKCLSSKLIYQAEVTNDKDQEKKIYVGLTERTFIERYGNHKKSFAHKRYSKDTELSCYIWSLKDQNKTPVIKWSILKTVKSSLHYHPWVLCLMEKLIIINKLDNEQLLNKRNEFISKCRHSNKLLLSNVKDDSNDW